jgi:anti-sigma factor RsiW
MNEPRDNTLRLNAFVDGELALDEQLQVEQQLQGDAAARAHVDRLRALREAVRDRASYHAAPAELRARILATLEPHAAKPQPRARWFEWRSWALGAALATMAAVALNLSLTLRSDTRIEDDVIASHVRATLGQRWVDVASSDHHTVKPWLSSRLDFSPPVHDIDEPASKLLGGRVDYINGRPVAALAYRNSGHMVDEFVWPATAGDKAIAQSSSRGFNIAHWSRGGMTHWLISDLNPGELARFAAQRSAQD